MFQEGALGALGGAREGLGLVGGGDRGRFVAEPRENFSLQMNHVERGFLAGGGSGDPRERFFQIEAVLVVETGGAVVKLVRLFALGGGRGFDLRDERSGEVELKFFPS